MLLGTNKSIEDRILEALAERPGTPKALWIHINNPPAGGEPTSIQAVYKSLRQLLKDGVVVKARHKISLNEEWVHKLNHLFNKETSRLHLEEGETLIYKFKGLSELDKYWKHVVIGFIHTLKGPVFHSEPHEMWIHLEDRYQSQIEYIQSFAKHQRYCYLVFGGTTTMDTEYKRAYQNEYLNVDLQNKPTFIKRNQFVTIIGDTIITTIISAPLAEKIDKLYDSIQEKDPEFGNKLKEVFINPGPVKLRIERNKLKARKLRKQLSKNFYIPQELIGEYKLF